jgi:hypothetical protein
MASINTGEAAAPSVVKFITALTARPMLSERELNRALREEIDRERADVHRSMVAAIARGRARFPNISCAIFEPVEELRQMVALAEDAAEQALREDPELSGIRARVCCVCRDQRRAEL